MGKTDQKVHMLLFFFAKKMSSWKEEGCKEM